MLEYIMELVKNPPYDMLAAAAAAALALSEFLGFFSYFKESSILGYAVKYAKKLAEFVDKKR